MARSTRYSKQYCTRLLPPDAKLMERLARKAGMTVSEWLRMVVAKALQEQRGITAKLEALRDRELESLQ